MTKTLRADQLLYLLLILSLPIVWPFAIKFQGMDIPATDFIFVAAAAHVLPSGKAELLTDAHNSWLSIASQEGVVGLLAFAGFVFLLLKGCFPLRLGQPPEVLVRTGLCIASPS